ncbi:kinase-like protein [Cylindrobasidium torrendii FP15055 ss-10]|uniref:non-specific serine/threonine protein kinase n=1 Tax=Cylindrobasidium torrendii FP15055 ss-10 TaxID=1314674 RepID=A0A0D7BT32_9AGAR|nr:kinase-like protein [Cylindrobasidium torrendii FP15055 ss-10]
MRARASNLTPAPSTPADSGSAVLPPNTPSNVADPAPPSSTETPIPNGSATETAAVANDFDLAKGENQLQQEQDEGAQIMAGDYDPSMDRREDEQKRVHVDDVQAEFEEEVEIEEDEDDLDDMFAAVTSAKPKVKRVVKKKKPIVATVLANTTDSAADPEGYYNIILAEQLDGGRYQVFSHLGKGMFASVVRARVLKPEQGEAPMREVAIKIVRSQESMYKSGLKEAQILQKLQQADVDDKRHLVRLERTFEHRGHLCLVFESLSMNLREVVKRFGKDVGLNLKAVRAYSHQLFIALNHLKKVGVVHADIKPDNILVNEAKNLLKLCDLGSASDAAESEITPYLVSRFYRAPEIIMGYPYDSALDVWSAGCTLYELYTGKILLPGRSNNHMLLLMMELKGRFNSKMIKKAQFGDVYFDDLGAFSNVEHDRVTGMDVIKKVHISKPSRELKQRLLPSTSVKMKDDESKLLMSFIDFLDKCLVLDPAKRMTAKEALVHPFIRG